MYKRRKKIEQRTSNIFTSCGLLSTRKSSLFSAVLSRQPHSRRSRAELWGWVGGNKTEKPRRKRAPRCQEIHSTVRGGIESVSGGPGCRLESRTWHRRARLPSPSPASQALHRLVCSCRDRATCPQTPKQRHVHTVWGRGDGLQAEGQSTKSLLTPKLSPLRLHPCRLRCGCLWSPGHPYLPGLICCLLDTVFIYESSVGHHPKKEGVQEEMPPQNTQSPPLPLCYRHVGLGTRRCLQKQSANVQTARNTLLQDERHISERERFEGIYKTVHRLPSTVPPKALHDWLRVMQDTQRNTSLQHPLQMV